MTSALAVFEHADCREYLATLTPGSFATCVVDPPYGTTGSKHAGGYGRRQNYGDGKTGRRIKNDHDLSVFREAMPLILAALPDDAWLAIWHSPRRPGEMARLVRSFKLKPFGDVIWDKGRPGLGHRGIRYQHEPCMIVRKGKPEQPACELISHMRVVLPRHDAAERHVHDKPVPFLRRIVRFVCPPGGTVLDPFAGRASTAVASYLEGRDSVSIEIDEEHVGPARDRLHRAMMQHALAL